MMNYGWEKISADTAILRELAKRYMAIATSEEMQKTLALWQKHNDLAACRPLLLVESGVAGLQEEIQAQGGYRLRSQAAWARQIESALAWRLWHHEVVRDDDILNPFWGINWFVNDSGYGVEVKKEYDTDSNGGSLGYHWTPPIKDIVEDFPRLKIREFAVDRDKSLAYKTLLTDTFGDIMPVEFRHGYGSWTLGLTLSVIDLIGLEALMLNMYDQPAALHQLMAYSRDDHLAQVDFLEKEGLLSLNNLADRTGSGSRGATNELGAGLSHGAKVKRRDMWCLSESQETVGVSPAMFAEFILPYQKEVCESFGRTYYGCCEPLDLRWEYVKTIKNLRAVSVSPWSNENFMTEALGRNYVYSRKPNPAMLSTPRFDEAIARQSIQNTLTVAQNCNVEIVLKDLHTTCGHPERLRRWVEICREEITKAGW